MSYLLQYVRRATSPARVDEHVVLNLPEFDGGAHVRVYVENTADRKFRRTPPEPHLKLRIADCVNEATLEFNVGSPEARENSLYKINTLIAALHRFRDALAAEADLYEQRER
jgi:hypothetical protein